VGLAPLSKPLILNTFMQIETPEDPQHFPVKGLEAAQSYGTIGLFYAAIADKLTQLGDGIFTGDPARQVVDDTWFPADQLFPISDVASAVRGIAIIVDQGEGTQHDPMDPDGEPAHYYRFAEIYYGRRLVADASEPQGYSYSGDPIPFDQTGVWDMVTDPKVANYVAGSTAQVYAERFNGIYTNLLDSLHLAFNGRPDHLRAAIGGMYELRLSAEALIQIPDAKSGKLAAPTFEYALQTA
jgi:hypothetical protein